KNENEAAVLHGLGAIYRQAALFLTNKENLVAENGDASGTVINSNRQLWSVAGNLAMVYRLLFGMDFEPDGIVFKPFVPKAYVGERQLTNFRYRNAELDIKLKGWGKGIKKITLDGKPLTEARIPGNLSGKHSVEITLDRKK